MVQRNTRQRQPAPPWLTWGVVVFIGLAILINFTGTKQPQMLVPPPSATSSAPPSINWNAYSLEAYKARLIPAYGRLHLVDVKTGEGPQAACGQEVTIRYGMRNAAAPQNTAEQTAEPSLVERTLRLGTTDIPEGLQAGVIGMRPGGKREIDIPSERTKDRQQNEYYTVELIRAAPPAAEPSDKAIMPLQAFDREPGNLLGVRCGQKIQAHLVIWDLSGKQLLNTHENDGQPIIADVGDGTFMQGIERGILDMPADGARTLIIPPFLQTPLYPEPKAFAAQKKEGESPEKTPVSTVQRPEILRNLALPANQSILVDVQLVPWAP